MASRRAWRMFVSVLWLCLIPIGALAQLDVTGIARSGDPAPGVPGFEFVNFRGPAVSSGAGDVAFAATIRREVSPGTFVVKTGVWVWHAGVLNLVALQGDEIPGETAGVVLGSLFPTAAGEGSVAQLNVNDLGQVTWRNIVAGTGVTLANDTALFVAGPNYGSLQMIAREGAQVPGAAAGQHFLQFGLLPPRLNDAGEVLFHAAEFGPDGGKGGLWAGLPGNLKPVVRSGDIAPTGTTFAGPAANAVINNNGVIAARLNSAVLATAGIWTATPNGIGGYDLLQIAAVNTADFFGIQDPAINDAGQVAFREASDIRTKAIWLWTPGAPPTLVRVVAAGELATGVSGTFKSFDAPLTINATGQIVYRAIFLDPAVGFNQTGLWTETSAGRTLVIGTDTPAPGGVGNFGSAPQGAAINAAGTILFQGADASAAGFWFGPADNLQLLVRDRSPGNEIRFEDDSTCAIGLGTLQSRPHVSGNQDGRPGILSDTGQIAMSFNNSGGGCSAVFIHPRLGNEAPTAVAGDNQIAARNVEVWLDGSESFDDNTESANLLYDWTLQVPDGSASELSAPTGPTDPIRTFTPDLPGDYIATLTVTDEGGLSDQDDVVISSNNQAPTAIAGVNLLVPVGQPAALDGTGSTDPENDLLITFAWLLEAQPEGSFAVIVNPGQEVASLTPDLPGDYVASLVVTDDFGAVSDPAFVTYTATLAPLPEDQILDASNLVFGLPLGDVTARGNQVALLNHLRQAVAAIQIGDIDEAIHKLEMAISRTDGCANNDPPAPDGNGKGRDWITNCGSQGALYNLLTAALALL